MPPIIPQLLPIILKQILHNGVINVTTDNTITFVIVTIYKVQGPRIRCPHLYGGVSGQIGWWNMKLTLWSVNKQM